MRIGRDVRMRRCNVDGCDNERKTKMYCNKHRQRFMRHGDPLIKTKVAKGYWEDIGCQAPECDRQAKIKGICTLHYQRDLRLKNKGMPFKYQREKEHEND